VLFASRRTDRSPQLITDVLGAVIYARRQVVLNERRVRHGQNEYRTDFFVSPIQLNVQNLCWPFIDTVSVPEIFIELNQASYHESGRCHLQTGREADYGDHALSPFTLLPAGSSGQYLRLGHSYVIK
jgi:hypothetical protein